MINLVISALSLSLVWLMLSRRRLLRVNKLDNENHKSAQKPLYQSMYFSAIMPLIPYVINTLYKVDVATLE